MDAWHPWPMSLISSIFGTDDDNEILDALYTIANVSSNFTHFPLPLIHTVTHTNSSTYSQHTSNLGLIHESQSIYNPSDWTRPWFAWANSYFAEMILDLADRKPGLVMKGGERYVPGMKGSFSEVDGGGSDADVVVGDDKDVEEVEVGGEGDGEEGEGRKVLIKPWQSG